MIFRHEYSGGVWVDLEQPTEDEVRDITREFSISKRIETELLYPTPLPLTVNDEDEELLVLHFPAHDTNDGETKNQELDFVVGHNFIVTVRYEIVAPLYHLMKLLDAQKMIEGRPTLATDMLLEILFAHLYTAMRDHTNHLVENLARVEKDMFNGHERTTVRTISNINREFLRIEAELANQEEPLDHFLQALTQHNFFGTHFTHRIERIQMQRMQVERLVKTHRTITTELRETNIALLEVRQNEIMKTLTIVNFIFLPLGLITWTFTMRTEGMPFVDSPNAFWIVLAIMFGVAMLLITFFIKKRWLF